MFAIADLCTRIRLADLPARGRAFLEEFGPYVVIELILPGGSLIALLLWLYSRHKKTNAGDRRGRHRCVRGPGGARMSAQHLIGIQISTPPIPVCELNSSPYSSKCGASAT